jgi:hypothetical protein
VDEKVVLSLVSVFLGWALGQGATWFREWRNIERIKEGLGDELLDLKKQLQPVLALYERQLGVFAHGGVDRGYHLPISNVFFKQYYKDVMLDLTGDQRRSYQLIHASIDELNRMGDDLVKLVNEIFPELMSTKDKGSLRQLLRVWGSRSEALFTNAKSALWYIEYHLLNARSPVLELENPAHRGYAEFIEGVHAEIRRIVDEARPMTKPELAKRYPQAVFVDVWEQKT